LRPCSKGGALAERSQAERFIELMDSEVQRLALLIEDFLDLARAEHGAGIAHFAADASAMSPACKELTETIMENYRLNEANTGDDSDAAGETRVSGAKKAAFDFGVFWSIIGICFALSAGYVVKKVRRRRP